MKIIFVRHGHPDYVKDCLTELGHKQAEQAALRLKDEGIEHIYLRLSEEHTKQPYILLK